MQCEASKSWGIDPTGEHAEPCGAEANGRCIYCGWLCDKCWEESCGDPSRKFVHEVDDPDDYFDPE